MDSAPAVGQDAAEFYDKPMWKQVAILSGGLLYLGLTRIFIPAVLVLGVIELARWLL